MQGKDIAVALSAFWDWVDKRDIDKHVMSWAVFAVTVCLLVWSCHFAINSPRNGTDVAAILAAVWGPWNLVQAAVVNWYFQRARGDHDER